MKESAKPQVLLDYFISQDMGRGYLSCLTDSLRCAESPVIRLRAVVSAVPMNISSIHNTLINNLFQVNWFYAVVEAMIQIYLSGGLQETLSEP